MGCDPEIICATCRKIIICPPGRTTCAECIKKNFGSFEHPKLSEVWIIECLRGDNVCDEILEMVHHILIRHDVFVDPCC